ncbi:MAG: OmpA family protein [Rickettsiales bacterium]|jgi:outer membrane protein OmpA-like peptidoglycan-associated protein|nr:OmpA family protein [Rickettsiales bacterium]
MRIAPPIVALALFAMVIACSARTKPNDDPFLARAGEPSFEAMNGKAMIVAKPTLVRLGIKPLEQREARSYMTAIFDAMLPDLEKTNITYQMAGNDIILTIQAHLVLDGNARIREYIKPQLENFALILAQSSRSFVEFKGFTSSVGDKSSNLKKSRIEAASVAEFFLDRGVRGERIFIIGMGENMWIADNSTREGRLLNNRIEIRISPLI